MWEAIGRVLAGLITGLSERYRVSKGRRNPFKKVRCPECSGLIPSEWDDSKPAGYRWTSDKCPHCYWSYGNDKR